MTQIPVVVAHFDTSPKYLYYCLSSAAKLNCEVVLLGDVSNQHMWGNHWDTTLLKSEKYNYFIQSYAKMSSYSESYENAFWRRMFFLEEWMKEFEVSSAILLDSDVMSFANYSELICQLLPSNCISALMIPIDQSDFMWTASAHFSYWTYEGIKNFTNFCIDTYRGKNDLRNKLKAKYQWHLESKMDGGVSEMTLLYFWSQTDNRIHTLTNAMSDVTFDFSISSSCNHLDNEYRTKFGLKSLVFRKGIPYGCNLYLNKEIQFVCLHCQGDAKQVMYFLFHEKLRSFYYIGKSIGALRTGFGLNRKRLQKKLDSMLGKIQHFCL